MELRVRAPDKVSVPLTVRFPEERELVESEVNPDAAPAEVIFQVLEVMLASLVADPKVTFPEAVRFPPVEIPEEKSPNEAETPEPVWGGEL